MQRRAGWLGAGIRRWHRGHVTLCVHNRQRTAAGECGERVRLTRLERDAKQDVMDRHEAAIAIHDRAMVINRSVHRRNVSRDVADRQFDDGAVVNRFQRRDAWRQLEERHIEDPSIRHRARECGDRKAAGEVAREPLTNTDERDRRRHRQA